MSVGTETDPVQTDSDSTTPPPASTGKSGKGNKPKGSKTKTAPVKAPAVKSAVWTPRSQGLPKVTFLLKQMADPTRAAILLNLVDGSRNVSDLCKIFKCSQPAVSHHLALMRSSEVVEAFRNGKFVEYSLAPKGKLLTKIVLEMIAKDQKAV